MYSTLSSSIGDFCVSCFLLISTLGVTWLLVSGQTLLHCTALHLAKLYYTALQCTELHYTKLWCTALHCTALQCTALHRSVLHRPAFYYTERNGVAIKNSTVFSLWRGNNLLNSKSSSLEYYTLTWWTGDYPTHGIVINWVSRTDNLPPESVKQCHSWIVKGYQP